MLAALVAGCGAKTHHQPATVTPPAVTTPWPTAADYGTIKTATRVRDDMLYGDRGWRVKSFAASLAIQTLLTVRLAAGSCAIYVIQLYGNLKDLTEAYPGEDWRPLVRLVRRQPTLAAACRRPPGHEFAA